MNTVAHAAAQGWFESLRLAWGAWLSSSGAGILGAIVAGLVALRLADKNRAAEKEKDRDADARERWWAAYKHLWDSRTDLPLAALTRAIRSMGEVSTTHEQQTMLVVFATYLRVQRQQRRS